MHIGITPWQFNSSISADALCQQAEQAQAWGYHSFWLPERHFAGDQSLPDPLMLLAAIAARTSTIKLATTSYLLPMRNPLLAAEQVAVLDQLSEGRLILGLGRGFQQAMLQAFKIDPKRKRDLFDQMLADMKKAWAGDPMGCEELPVQLFPRTVQQPHPPMMMAAFGPKALRQAAKHGLPYLASPMESLPQLEVNRTIYIDAMNEFGHREKAEIAAMRTLFVCEDQQRCKHVEAQLQAQKKNRMIVPETADSPWIVGNADKVEDEIALYKERLKLKTLVATRPSIKGLAPQWCEESFHALAQILL
jgi:alkanesulfonate monooxygenase SsuD/methylene tetrahydromethanopterin reductase-like flavin-dependent oxidoreductase (luciferase family)